MSRRQGIRHFVIRLTPLLLVLASGCRGSDEKTPGKAEPKAGEATTPMKEAGKSGEGDTAGARMSAREPVLAWTVEGAWTGVAADAGTGAIYAVSIMGSGLQLDATGKKQRGFRIDDDRSILRLARLAGDNGPQFVTFAHWGPAVKAHDSNGKLLWTYKEGQGVDDVCAADLNGDGLDEVIVGYNGSTGLHVLDHRGTVLWKHTTPSFANVWHVCAGDIDGDHKPEVVTSSAIGNVHIFDARGNKIKDVATGHYATMVRLARVSPGNKALHAIVGCHEVANDKKLKSFLLLIDFDGNTKWSVSVPGFINSAQVASSRPWVGVSMADGSLYVVDIRTGAIIAATGGQGNNAEVAWSERSGTGSPLLLVAADGGLKAFRITAE